jgi:hypothetical protein
MIKINNLILQWIITLMKQLKIIQQDVSTFSLIFSFSGYPIQIACDASAHAYEYEYLENKI